MSDDRASNLNHSCSNLMFYYFANLFNNSYSILLFACRLWQKSIAVENTPKTLAKYYDMKYNNKREYSVLQKYAKMVDKGEVLPLLGCESFITKALEIRQNAERLYKIIKMEN